MTVSRYYILFGFPPLIVVIANNFSLGCMCYVWLIRVYTHNVALRKNSPNCFLPLVFQYSFIFSFLFFTHYLCVLHLFISSPTHTSSYLLLYLLIHYIFIRLIADMCLVTWKVWHVFLHGLSHHLFVFNISSKTTSIPNKIVVFSISYLVFTHCFRLDFLCNFLM